MIINEDLQYAVIDKFSYEWTEIQDLRKLIPEQCELKGEVNIGLPSNTYILIRATRLEDYVHLPMTIGHNHYIHSNGIHCLTQRRRHLLHLRGYSFHLYHQIFFGKVAMFSLAAAVGKPL